VTSDPFTATVWFTTWATTKVSSYASAGSLWRFSPGEPCVLVTRFADPLGHPNGVFPDGEGGAYVTTTGNYWQSGAVLGPRHYGALWHYAPRARANVLIHEFTAQEGGTPMPALARGSEGALWGITAGVINRGSRAGPTMARSRIFRVTHNTFGYQLDFAHTLAGGQEGGTAATQLTAGSGGDWIYGATTDAHTYLGSPGGGSVFRFKPATPNG